MAELDTIPVNTDEDEEERKRRELEAMDMGAATDRRRDLNEAGAAAAAGLTPVVSPTVGEGLRSHTSGTDLRLADEIEATHPKGANVKEGALEPIQAPDLATPSIAPHQDVNAGLQPITGGSAVKQVGASPDLAQVAGATPTPGSAADYRARLQKIQEQEQHKMGDHPSFMGKVGHVLGRIGNIAGTVLAPAEMELIPGTDLNRAARKAGDQTLLAAAEEREQKAAHENETEAETARHNKEAERLEEERIKKPPTEKQGPTIDQAAIDAKMKEINPATGKNWTPYEARIELANDIAAGKAKPAGPPKTIVMQGPDKKNYEYQYDPQGNYTGDEGYEQWKKIGPAKPDSLSLGLIGTLTPLLGPNGQIVGTLNTKTGQMQGLTPSQAAVVGPGGTGGTTGTGARLANTELNQFNTQVVNPARQIETNFQKATQALDAYNANPQTGAAGMVLFAQHLGTTLGGIKGAAIGEHAQALHANAIGLADRISRWVDKNATGQPLAESQVKEFYDLIKETRQITWQLAARAAQDRRQDVNFLPNDVEITMVDSNGKARGVPAGKVKEYMDKGAKIQ
jgi:hypothetical protein